MFWSAVTQMWLLMQLCNVTDKRMHQWSIKTVSMSLMIILQSLNIKRSVMMLFSLNDDEKNTAVENNNLFIII